MNCSPQGISVSSPQPEMEWMGTEIKWVHSSIQDNKKGQAGPQESLILAQHMNFSKHFILLKLVPS